MILKRTKKYKNVINLLAKPIAILLVLFSLLFLFSMDERQQNNYPNLRDGYIKLNEHNFTDASKIFSDYLASHDSSLYWWLVENINDRMYSSVSVGRFSPFRVGLKTPISVNL